MMQITCDNGVFKNGDAAVNVEKVKCNKYFDPEIEILSPTRDSEMPCSKLVADGRKSSEVEDNGLKRVSIGWKLKGQHQTQVQNRYVQYKYVCIYSFQYFRRCGGCHKGLSINDVTLGILPNTDGPTKVTSFLDST